MDKEVRPQDDFYNYVNGTWMKNTEIPDDKTRWGNFNELRENTDADVLAILKKPQITLILTPLDETKAVQLYQLINDTVTPIHKVLTLFAAFRAHQRRASKGDIQPYLEKLFLVETVHSLVLVFLPMPKTATKTCHRSMQDL